MALETEGKELLTYRESSARDKHLWPSTIRLPYHDTKFKKIQQNRKNATVKINYFNGKV